MGKEEDILGGNDPEDVSWLCSLSESELDMLIGIKNLVIQRTRVIGREHLANKFDLKMLRAIGFVLVEHLRGQIKEMPDFSDSAELYSLLNGSNFLNGTVNENMNPKELEACVSMPSRKRKWGQYAS